MVIVSDAKKKTNKLKMNNLIDKFFESKKTFYASAVVGVLSYIYYLVFELISNNFNVSGAKVFILLAPAALLGALIYAYVAKNKNLILIATTGLLLSILFFESSFIVSDWDLVSSIFIWIYFGTIVAFSAMHIFIHSDSRPHKKVVIGMQSMVILWLLSLVVLLINWLITYQMTDFMQVFIYIFFFLSGVSSVIAILALETRIDAFRDRREKTEER